MREYREMGDSESEKKRKKKNRIHFGRITSGVKPLLKIENYIIARTHPRIECVRTIDPNFVSVSTIFDSNEKKVRFSAVFSIFRFPHNFRVRSLDAFRPV